MGRVAVYVGAAFLIAVGGAIAKWPAKVAAYLTDDEEGNALPVTPGVVQRTRLSGLALIAFGAVLVWYGPDAFTGPVDMGAP